MLNQVVSKSLTRPGALKRTTIDNRIAGWMGAGQEVEVERYAGKTAYWLIMLFVLVAFFQALNLTNVTEPLNVLLSQLTGFAPRLLGAGTLLLAAWLVATVVKKLIIGAMVAARVDERLSGEAEVEKGKTVPVSKALADGVYGLIFLLFLPAILGALALEGLLVPVQQLVDGLLGFLPNILAAGLILAVGWFVAHLVRRIVTNLLATMGVDRLGDQMGAGQVLGAMRLSGLVGLIVYVLILFPVLISSLNALQLAAITEPASEMLGTILDVIPSLFAAVLLVSVAYFVGRLVSGLIGNVLAGAGFDNILAQLGLGRPTEGGRKPSGLVSTLILVAILLFASVEAASLLGFVNLAEMLSGFITLGGQVILGLVVFGIGLYLANLAATTVRRAGIPPGGRRPCGDHRPDQRHGPATDGAGERDHQSRLRRPARCHRRCGRAGFRPRRARRRGPGGRAVDRQAGGPTVEYERHGRIRGRRLGPRHGHQYLRSGDRNSPTSPPGRSRRRSHRERTVVCPLGWRPMRVKRSGKRTGGHTMARIGIGLVMACLMITACGGPARPRAQLRAIKKGGLTGSTTRYSPAVARLAAAGVSRNNGPF